MVKQPVCALIGHVLTILLGDVDTYEFSRRLWGDIYFDRRNRKFTRKQSDPEDKRTFVHFILEPLYKLYSQVSCTGRPTSRVLIVVQVLSEDTDALKETLAGLGIELKPVLYKMDARPLLKAVLDQFFGPSTGLVDMLLRYVPAADEANKHKAGNSSTTTAVSNVAV